MYGKVFASLWQGTLFGKGDQQLVFIYLLAHSDTSGFVDIHPAVISAATGLSMERVTTAISDLVRADANSRTDTLNGSRLEPIDEHRDWGWRVVNKAKYRDMADTDTRREQNRLAQQKRRQHLSASVSSGQHSSAQADVEAEEDHPSPLKPPLPSRQQTAGPRKRGPVFSPPDFLPPEPWEAFVAHRKAMGKPMTERAAVLICNKLKEFHVLGDDPTSVLEQSIASGWTGIFRLKASQANGDGPSASSTLTPWDKDYYRK